MSAILKDTKRVLACASFIGLMLFILFTFITYAFSAESTFKLFTLNINSKDVVVKLPNDLLPPMKNAIYEGEQCFNLIVCIKQYYFADPPFVLDYVDFVYKDNTTEVIALVWTKTLESVYVAWKYVDGIPVLVNHISEINDLIRDAEKSKESNFKHEPKPVPIPPIFGPILPVFGPVKPFLTFIDFTYEGELNPDNFNNWKVLKTEFDSGGIVWMYWQNPNFNSLIKVVVGEVSIDGILLRYRYFKNDRPYIFSLDSEQNKYVQYNFTDEEKKSCMKCHQDKVEPEIPEIKLKGVFFRVFSI